MKTTALLLLMAVALPHLGMAQAPPPPPAAPSVQDPVAATEAYLARLSPEQRAKSDSYFEGGYWLILWDFLYGLGVAALLLGTGLSARMRNLAERAVRFRPVQVFLYWLQYLVLTTLLTFPLVLYAGFFREHKYGLSNQTFPEWLIDLLKGVAVGALLGGLAVVGIYAIFRKFPRTWWVWGTVAAVVFLVFVMLIAPVFIAPLFNTYTELKDANLRGPILSLARANGIPAEHVYVFDASKQSNRVSANVSGALGTMRISLNDNLLNRVSPAGVKSVMGHEMGHYVLNHVYKFILEVGVLFAVVFALLQRGLAAAVARWGTGWRVRGVSDVAGLPVLACILGLLFLLATPVTNSMIRSQETEADMYGLNASRQPDGFARAALHLAESRKMKPGPIEELIFFDHPSGLDRIRRSMVWKAEHLKDPDMVVQGNL
ncbi:MAG: M48 family metallopeptidase [Thermoanaerobaculia bacterium]